MKVKEITDCIESVAPLAFQEDYDNSGLIIGNHRMDVTGVLITLDITDGVIEEAARKGCNLVVSHHPLIFKGLKRFSEENHVQGLIMKAIKSDLGIYAAHTSIDNSSRGLNRFLMRKLDVKDPSVLLPAKGQLCKLVTFCPVDHADNVRQALFDAGAGHIGKYDSCSYNLKGEGTFRPTAEANPFVGEKNQLHVESEVRIEVIYNYYMEKKLIDALQASHPYEEVAYDLYPLANTFAGAGAGMIGDLDPPRDEKIFLKNMKKLLAIPFIRHSKWLNKPVKKIAVCGGSGAFLLPEAIKSNADIFLTGDIRYHDFQETGDSIILADIGHFESEQWVKELIYEILIEKFPNFAILISEINTNPVNYF